MIVRSICGYQGLIKPLLLRFKYNGEDVIGREIAQIMYERFSFLTGLEPTNTFFDCIVVPPSDWRQYKRRGYNPAGIVATQFSKRSKIPFLRGALIKTQSTPAQNSLNFSQRRKNLKGNFEIPSRFNGSLRKKRVIIIDDVYTTGATLAECARNVRKAGAFGVLGLTFARTPRVSD